jgi:hypothetical protein
MHDLIIVEFPCSDLEVVFIGTLLLRCPFNTETSTQSEFELLQWHHHSPVLTHELYNTFKPLPHSSLFHTYRKKSMISSGSFSRTGFQAFVVRPLSTQGGASIAANNRKMHHH